MIKRKQAIVYPNSVFSPFNFIKEKECFVMFLRFIRNQTYKIFYSCIFPLLYIVISEISISFSITDLLRTKIHAFPISNFLVYRFHGNIDYLENHIHLKFNLLFRKLVYFSQGSDQGKVAKMPTENARYGPGKTVSNYPKVSIQPTLDVGAICSD